MIGNDIVDLKEASLKSNWERPGFLKKIFSTKEQKLIKNADQPFEMVWRMWSMKESAYKLYFQKNPLATRGFYPCKIKTKILTHEKGQVFLEKEKFLTRTQTQPSYIFTTAFSDPNILNENGIFYLPKKNYQFQSYFIRQKLFGHIAKQKQFKQEELELRNGKNHIPKLYYRAKLLPLKCSLTHHGNYGGFSISL